MDSNSTALPASSRLRKRVGVLIAVCSLVLAGLALAGPTAPANATGTLPCDIYSSAGTPCVGAFSTTRALFSSYNGSLYQVTRASDHATQDVGLLAAGGYANAATQDTFCASTTCEISKVYDQTSQHNDLLIEGPGTQGGQDVGAPAAVLPVQAGGHKVYGIYVTHGVGYRHTSGSGLATNGSPEGMYMVTSGHTANGGCCFDFGNVEVPINDTGKGHMDALNFSNFTFGGTLAGNGPWVEADLEDGVFPGSTANTGDSSRFVTALLKNDGQTTYALKGGDSQSGALTTWYSGALPSGYSPMHQEGSIVLGTGGDNSNNGTGSFFEGVMTAGYPTDAADDSVQSNIVSVGYTAPSNGTLNVNSEVSLVTPSGTSVRHAGGLGYASSIGSGSNALDRADATFVIRPGLADSNCVSFDSRNYPGNYLRHQSGRVKLNQSDGTSLFAADATFCPQAGKNGSGSSFASYNFPSNYIRVINGELWISPDDGSPGWNDSVSYTVSPPWA